MKTNDFIDMLAAGVTPVERGVPARRLGSALAVAAVGAVLLMTIAFGVRPDLSAVMRTPIFWAKLAFPICVAAGAIMATVRLARPSVRAGWWSASASRRSGSRAFMRSRRPHSATGSRSCSVRRGACVRSTSFCCRRPVSLRCSSQSGGWRPRGCVPRARRRGSPRVRSRRSPTASTARK